MPSKPRKPWRVIVSTLETQATYSFTSEAKTYAFIRTDLPAIFDSPADTARVEQWEDGCWRWFETVTADEIRAAQAAIRNIDEK
ncbi:hypothetical protein [Streptomyces ardesiacus]|uniref:hypothetical protein n=1 Tax=Streptomyces ardesiacus TaxID=285564 RepID=UPI003F49F66F